MPEHRSIPIRGGTLNEIRCRPSGPAPIVSMDNKRKQKRKENNCVPLNLHHLSFLMLPPHHSIEDGDDRAMRKDGERRWSEATARRLYGEPLVGSDDTVPKRVRSRTLCGFTDTVSQSPHTNAHARPTAPFTNATHRKIRVSSGDPT